MLALLVCVPLAAHSKIPPKSKRGPRDLLIVAGGDVAYPRGWMDRLVERRGEKMFEQVRGFAKAADLAFVNLESPYTDRPFKLKKQFQVVTPPPRLDYVLSGGFNLFSLANNHMFDAGPEGIDDTLALLAEKKKGNPNLWWAGAGKTSQEALKPAVFTVPGKQLEVCFHSFGYAGSSLVAIPGTEESFAAVKRSAGKCDLVIVSVHHGIEYHHVPPKAKAELYRRYIDAGADVLLGHHPHVIQGIEVYKKGIIFHSLGNFSFASKTNRHHATGAKLYSILPLIYIKDGKVERAEVLPLYVNNSEPWTLDGKTLASIDFTPQVLKGGFAQAVMSELRDWTAAIPGIAKSAVEAYQIKGDRIRLQVRR